MNLDSLRSDIDRIDTNIIGLLEERMEKALLLRRHKAQTADGERERAVLSGVRARAGALNPATFLEDLYGRIMARSREVQDLAPPLAAFQGAHGAYSEVAAMAWNDRAAPVPFKEFSQVFNAVLEGDVDFGVVPVENTLGGIVGQVNSILVATELRITGAVDLPIRHCLLAPAGADHRSLRVVYSHPQALSQCRSFLARNRLEGREYFDTAGAAMMVAAERIPGAAALASRQAGERYGLETVKEGVEDSGNNRTRFFIVSRQDVAAKAGGKCSAVFFTDNKAGALFGILEIFAGAGINLTRIESVPDKPGDYAIFIDFEGSSDEDRVSKALAQAELKARDFRLLGCYDERRVDV